MPPVDTSSPAALVTGLLGQLVAQTGLYFVVVGGLYLLVWRWGRARFASRRVQRVERADRAQIGFEVKHTLITMVFSSVNAGGLIALTAAGWTRLSLSADGHSTLAIAGTVVGLVLFNDLWFYGCHRALHTPWLFKHVHSVHHRSIDTTPFTSYSFHAVEALLMTAWLIPAAMLLPIPVPALALTAMIGLANNVMAHLGYEFFPAWLMRVPGLRLVNTATFHGLHHARSHGNYGLFTRVWDRLLGTELDGYEAAFAERR